MLRNSILKKIFQSRLVDQEQVKLVYLLSLIVGLFSALAAAFLKNAIHFTNQLLTGGYRLLIPLIITSAVAYITTRSFEKHSIYHVQLAEREELVTHQHTGICLLSFHRNSNLLN